MKHNRLFFIAIATTILLLFGIGCDQGENPVQSFREVVDKIPNLEPIEGAENVSKVVKTNFDQSYFTIEIRNVTPGSALRNGVYNGWCAQMDVSITTNVETHGHQVFSTEKDGKYQYINYLLNKQNSYRDSYANLTWKEIQVAIWVILETNDFNLSRIESRIPNSVNGFSSELVNTIISDIKKNGWKYRPEFGHIKANYVNNENEQDTIFEGCDETAWARMNNDPDNFTYAFNPANGDVSKVSGGNWATYLIHMPTGTEREFYLYAGQFFYVGKLLVWKDADFLYVKYVLESGIRMTETHLHVATSLAGIPKAGPTQNPNPGGFDHQNEYDCELNVSEDTYQITWDDGWDGINLYIAAHAVVSSVECECEDED